jgi:hypothetical protein
MCSRGTYLQNATKHVRLAVAIPVRTNTKVDFARVLIGFESLGDTYICVCLAQQTRENIAKVSEPRIASGGPVGTACQVETPRATGARPR